MLWSDYINSYKGEKIKVEFLEDYTLKEDEIIKFIFNKNSFYHIPKFLYDELIKDRKVKEV